MKAKTKEKTKKATRGATAEKRAERGTIPLKAICAKLGLDPKASRVRLRRFLRSDQKGVAFHQIGSRWDLTPSQAKEVEAFLAS